MSKDPIYTAQGTLEKQQAGGAKKKAAAPAKHTEPTKPSKPTKSSKTPATKPTKPSKPSKPTKAMPKTPASAPTVYDRTVGPVASRLFSLFRSKNTMPAMKGGAGDELDLGMLSKTRDMIETKDVYNIPIDPKITGYTSYLNSVTSTTKTLDNRPLASIAVYGGAKNKTPKKKPSA